MSGGGGSTTTQKADPWSGIQPSLQSLYGNLNTAYNNGNLSPAQNTGQVASNGNLDAILQSIYQTGTGFNGGDQTLQDAIVKTQNLAGGNFSNLQGADTLQKFAGGQWQADPATGMMSNVAGGNTAGSGAYDTLNKYGQGQFGGTAQGDALTQMAGGNFTGSQAGQQLTNLSNGNFSSGAYGLLNSLAKGQFSGTGLDQLVKTSNGAYTDPNNSAVKGLYNAQAQPLTQQFQQSTLPGLLSAYSAAGRYGSGANDSAINSASSALGQTLSNLSQSTIGQNYVNERANQQNAAGQLAGYQTGAASQLGGYQTGATNTLLGAQGTAANGLLNAQTGAATNMAGIQSQLAQYLTSLRSGSAGTLAGIQGSALSALPGMAGQQSQNQWTNLSNASAAAQQQQQIQQGILNSGIAQSNYNNNSTLLGLNNLSGLLQNGMALNGQTSQTSGGSSTLQRVGGGALSGAMAGTAVMPGLGTAIGAIGGGLLGVL